MLNLSEDYSKPGTFLELTELHAKLSKTFASKLEAAIEFKGLPKEQTFLGPC